MNAVEITDLEKNYGTFQLNVNSLILEEGVTAGLIGVNGSGKSTLIRCMFGLAPFYSGSINILGHNSRNDSEGIKNSVAYVSEEPKLYYRLNALRHGALMGRLNSRWDSMAFQTCLKDLEIPTDIKAGNLSKGERMKLSLALALGRTTDFLILDEPASGIDPVMRRRMMELLAEWREPEGRTLLISTHLTDSLENLVDRVIMLNNGTVMFHEDREILMSRCRKVSGPLQLLDHPVSEYLEGVIAGPYGFSSLTRNASDLLREWPEKIILEQATLEDIMVHSMAGAVQ